MGARPSYEQFISDIFLIQKGRYQYNRESYESKGGSFTYTCPVHGEVTQGIKAHKKPGVCNQCGQKIVAGRKTYKAIIKLKKKLQDPAWSHYTFDFSTFTKMREPMKANCDIHGEFTIIPSALLTGLRKGCPECSKINRGTKRQTTIKEWQKQVDSKFGKGQFIILGRQTKKETTYLTVDCKDHGKFTTRGVLLTTKSKFGCPECAKKGWKRKPRLPKGEIQKRIEKKFPGKFNFSKANITTIRAPFTLICKKHQKEFQTTYKILSKDDVKFGCPLCNPTKLTPFHRINKKLCEATNNKYIFKEETYTGVQGKITAYCKEHKKEFTSWVSCFLKSTSGCPECKGDNGVVSWPQENLAIKLQSYGIKVIQNNRKILEGKEIDILLPEYNIGIEYNGLIWHSTRYKQSLKEAKWHMVNKQALAKEKGINLVHFDSSIPMNKMIDLILFKCGKTKKIGARKTFITTVPPKQAHKFLDKHHLQGAVKGCKYLGLRYKEELVGVIAMSVSNSERGNKDKTRWELRRMAFSYQVIGGASKLFKNFLTLYPKISTVVSFSDNRWFQGGVYEALGFNLDYKLPPDYGYTDGSLFFHKSRFKKSNLRKKENFLFEEWMTETQACELNGYFKFFDCGKKKWIYNH